MHIATASITPWWGCGKLIQIKKRVSGQKGKLKNRLFLIAVPLWLLGILFALNLAVDAPMLGLVIALIWLLPLALFAKGSRFLMAPVFYEQSYLFMLVIIFLATIIFTSPLSLDPATSFQYSLVTVAGLILCGGVWSLIQGQEVKILAAFSLSGTTILALIYHFTYISGSRFGTIRNPNGIGLILLGLALSSFGLKSKIATVSVITVCFVMILATGSRSALIGTCIALIAYAVIGSFKRLDSVVLLLVISIVAGAVIYYHQDEVKGWTGSALSLEDRNRGTGSGYSGRLDLWRDAYELWLTSPVFGVGYRAHEFADAFSARSLSSHNGYLSTLAETGIVGAIPLFLLYLSGGYRLAKRAIRGCIVSRIGFGMLVGYLFVAVFERYLINFGTPTSILVNMFVLMPDSNSQCVATVKRVTPNGREVLGRYAGRAHLEGR